MSVLSRFEHVRESAERLPLLIETSGKEPDIISRHIFEFNNLLDSLTQIFEKIECDLDDQVQGSAAIEELAEFQQFLAHIRDSYGTDIMLPDPPALRESISRNVAFIATLDINLEDVVESLEEFKSFTEGYNVPSHYRSRSDIIVKLDRLNFAVKARNYEKINLIAEEVRITILDISARMARSRSSDSTYVNKAWKMIKFLQLLKTYSIRKLSFEEFKTSHTRDCNSKSIKWE